MSKIMGNSDKALYEIFASESPFMGFEKMSKMTHLTLDELRHLATKEGWIDRVRRTKRNRMHQERSKSLDDLLGVIDKTKASLLKIFHAVELEDIVVNNTRDYLSLTEHINDLSAQKLSILSEEVRKPSFDEIEGIINTSEGKSLVEVMLEFEKRGFSIPESLTREFTALRGEVPTVTEVTPLIINAPIMPEK